MLQVKLGTFIGVCLLFQILSHPSAPAAARAALCQGRCKLYGRVINAAGEPVPGATVTLEPDAQEAVSSEGNASTDLTLVEYKSGADGTFCIDEVSTPPSAREAVLFVASPLPQNVYMPITSSFLDYRKRRLFIGKRVPVGTGQEVKLGDVTINVPLGTFTIVLEDSAGRPLLDQRATPNLKLRVRDSKGDILVEDRIPPHAFNRTESTLAIALPNGDWGLEFTWGEAGKTWHALGKRVVVDASRQPGRAVLRLPVRDEQSRRLHAVRRGKRDGRSSALRRLAQLGIDYNPDSFVERAAGGNSKAVRLFLEAGMNPDAKDRNGSTALMAAVDYPEIEKILIASGSDVNVRNANGETVLMHAAVVGSVPSIQLLIDAGAAPNVRSNAGATPLILAAGNGYVGAVKTLLDAGADPRPKDNNGLSALDYAKRAGDQDIVELLERRALKQPEK